MSGPEQHLPVPAFEIGDRVQVADEPRHQGTIVEVCDITLMRGAYRDQQWYEIRWDAAPWDGEGDPWESSSIEADLRPAVDREPHDEPFGGGDFRWRA